MVIPIYDPDLTVKMATFFKSVFGNQADGFVCLAYMAQPGTKMDFAYFEYPQKLDQLADAATARINTHNIYFCPQLLEEPKRTKDTVKVCTNAWADLDECPPEILKVKPTILIETSEGRHQALWTFEDPTDPLDAEEISRRIAYAHADEGCDKSGWDLSQLLRVPYTYNFKYSREDPPAVTLRDVNTGLYRISDFSEYPPVTGINFIEQPLPNNDDLPTEHPFNIMQRYRGVMNPLAFGLCDTEPQEGEDWSRILHRLQMYCFEAGMRTEEVYVIGKSAKCNKFHVYRQGKKHYTDPEKELWRDTCRAYTKHLETTYAIINHHVALPELMTKEEVEQVQGRETFIERFIDWAQECTDAAPQYHQAGALTALSSVLAGNVKLKTSAGNMYVNLWFMILADTTLTRKTTAMNLASNLLMEIDDDILMATDGSIEGMLDALENRRGKSSLLQRDEISGFIEAMNKKDYMAGMSENLTKLYDGDRMKRILRRQTIDVREPRLIMFTGGIKTRVQSLLSFENVSSGFIPRFIIITAESDISRVRPLGPPDETQGNGRKRVLDELSGIHQHYTKSTPLIVGGQATGNLNPQWDVELTPEAWARFAEFETIMVRTGVVHSNKELMTPAFDRLAKSVLKVAVIIAAADRLADKVVVTKEDILKGIYYCRMWRNYTSEIVSNVGLNKDEMQLERILKYIKTNPKSSTRSVLMQRFRLSRRDADYAFDTLIQRMQIGANKNGSALTYYPITTKT